METVIEQQRRFHEERERLEDAMSQELLLKKLTYKEQINSDHRVHFLLDRYVEITGNYSVSLYSLFLPVIRHLFTWT